MTLKDRLLKQGKTNWLDVGCGGNFEDGFFYLDTVPVESVASGLKERYFNVDILNASDETLKRLGTFDLVRMQHALEHFSYEEGQQVLLNCAKLLNPDGIILITVPDLKVHVRKYLNGEYANWEGFKWWATKRIPEQSPDSFYFSVFTHSMSYESHKWCYDYEGLRFQLEHAGGYSNIQQLSVDDPLSSYPFTHNRPDEDLCVIARKNSSMSNKHIMR
jgi:predicted SAM-dependent methyltransferase